MLPGATREGGLCWNIRNPDVYISHQQSSRHDNNRVHHETRHRRHCAFIVELTERTPENDLTMGYLESAVEHKFPGLDVEQLHALKAGR
jgi:hypothetical protein